MSEQGRNNIRNGRLGLKCSPMSEEGRNSIRNGHFGLKYSPMSEQGKNNISRGHIGLAEGEKNPNWQGGKSFEPYGKDFNKTLKEQIRKRDNYQCQECGYFQKDLGYNLFVHHVDYNKKNNDTLNLISLCRNCHGQTNFVREDWIKYFKEYQSDRKEVI